MDILYIDATRMTVVLWFHIRYLRAKSFAWSRNGSFCTTHIYPNEIQCKDRAAASDQLKRCDDCSNSNMISHNGVDGASIRQGCDLSSRIELPEDPRQNRAEESSPRYIRSKEESVASALARRSHWSHVCLYEEQGYLRWLQTPDHLSFVVKSLATVSY